MADAADTVVTLTVGKEGRLRYLGHRDFARSLERVLRRSGLPLRMTEGFHPHPRWSLPEPLPLGVGSTGERFVVHLVEAVAPDRVRAALEPLMPEGMPLRQVRAGRHPEPREAPLHVELQSRHAGELEAALCRLDPAALGLGALAVSRSPAGVRIELTPPAGRRVSLGRFLRAVDELAEDRPGWVEEATRLHCIGAPDA